MLAPLLDKQPSSFDNVLGSYPFGTMHATPSVYAPLLPYAHTYFGMEKLAMDLLSFEI